MVGHEVDTSPVAFSFLVPSKRRDARSPLLWSLRKKALFLIRIPTAGGDYKVGVLTLMVCCPSSICRRSYVVEAMAGVQGSENRRFGVKADVWLHAQHAVGTVTCVSSTRLRSGHTFLMLERRHVSPLTRKTWRGLVFDQWHNTYFVVYRTTVPDRLPSHLDLPRVVYKDGVVSMRRSCFGV